MLVDPGHGGEDQGASHHDILEKDITLSVGLLLFDLLKQDPQFDPHLTRNKDSFVDLDDRIAKAEKIKADAMISIHANSSHAASARGTEIYFESQIPTDEESLLVANRENNIKKSNKDANDQALATDVKSILQDLKRSNHMLTSKLLSQAVLESMQAEFKTKSKAIRQGPFRVLTVSMPSTLVEMGFISNLKEAQWLKSSETQKKMALALHKGLVDFRKKLDKQKQ